ncbi:MAG: hypothetical protein PHV55_01250 [Candidatus Omnitrophica bacterium]|nr:hypothetical protein [Candidatus Omnitrophota bacterium]
MHYIYRIGALVILVVFLNGCTAYRLSGRTKNVSVDKTSPDLFTVNFCGNAHMTQAEVEKYALQRACQAALDNGYSYFFVIEKRDDSQICALTPAMTRMKEDVSASPSSTQVFGSYPPAKFVTPNVTLKIKCFSDKTQAPKDAIDARQFLQDNFPGLA